MDCKHLGPRRRRRLKYHRAKRDLLLIVVNALNFEVLGFPKIPPPCARVGAPISAAQAEVLEHLEVQIDHFMHMDPWAAGSLGRAQAKFELLIQSAEELPNCSGRLEDLTEFLSGLHSCFDPYSSHFSSHVFTEVKRPGI